MVGKAIVLEWYKFRRYKPFLIMLGLFILAYFTVGFSIRSLLRWFMEENANSQLSFFTDVGLPLFDFVDIWQNLAYITFLFKFILAFLVIISVTVEYSYKTIRQNFIDGLSRAEYVWSKITLVAALSVLSGFMLTVLGLSLGLMYSPVKSVDFIFLNFEFVFAHIFEVFAFLVMALFVATLIRKTGFAIVLFVLYALVIEPIGAAILQFQYELPSWYLPVRSINNIIHVPFPKYLFREIQDYIALKDMAIALSWTVLFTAGTFLLVKKRDV